MSGRFSVALAYDLVHLNESNAPLPALRGLSASFYASSGGIVKVSSGSVTTSIRTIYTRPFAQIALSHGLSVRRLLRVSGSMIQYSGTPNHAYLASLRFGSISADPGDSTSTTRLGAP